MGRQKLPPEEEEKLEISSHVSVSSSVVDDGDMEITGHRDDGEADVEDDMTLPMEGCKPFSQPPTVIQEIIIYKEGKSDASSSLSLPAPPSSSATLSAREEAIGDSSQDEASLEKDREIKRAVHGNRRNLPLIIMVATMIFFLLVAGLLVYVALATSGVLDKNVDDDEPQTLHNSSDYPTQTPTPEDNFSTLSPTPITSTPTTTHRPTPVTPPVAAPPPAQLSNTILTASDAAPSAGFGSAVDVNDNTIVVGAWKLNFSGAVYVYTRASDGRWMGRQKLANDNVAQLFNRRFGYAVALEGNILAVAAYGYAAFVYARKDPTSLFELQSMLLPPNNTESTGYARSIATDGETVVVGALGSDDGSGAVHVYEPNEENGGSWELSMTLSTYSLWTNKWFGGSVAIDGDTIVVGSSIQDNRGAAYVFRKFSGTWIDEGTLPVNGGLATYDGFGQSIAIAKGTVVVGAWQDDESTELQNTGAAYVFTKEGEQWVQQTKLRASDVSFGLFFGYSVDINENGVIVVGTQATTQDGRSGGPVYMFSKSSLGEWEETSKFISDAEADWFGDSVAIGDDGTVVVGAPQDSSIWQSNGAAHVFDSWW